MRQAPLPIRVRVRVRVRVREGRVRLRVRVGTLHNAEVLREPLVACCAHVVAGRAVARSAVGGIWRRVGACEGDGGRTG